MKRIILALALTSTVAIADYSKSVVTQIGDAAIANIGAPDLKEQKEIRNIRLSMKERIKPGSCIDEYAKSSLAA